MCVFVTIFHDQGKTKLNEWHWGQGANIFHAKLKVIHDKRVFICMQSVYFSFVFIRHKQDEQEQRPFHKGKVPHRLHACVIIPLHRQPRWWSSPCLMTQCVTHHRTVKIAEGSYPTLQPLVLLLMLLLSNVIF